MSFPRRSLLLLGLLGGCVADAPLSSPGFDEGGALPAFETEGETVDKADGVDLRDQYPETFGFTASAGNVDVLPGEFEPASRMIVAYPSSNDWVRRLVAAAAPFIDIDVVTPAAGVESMRRAVQGVNTTHRVAYLTDRELTATTDTVWMRDYGPLAVRNTDGTRRLVDFRYYWNRLYDDANPTYLASYWGWPVSRPRLELEGGNIQSNGAGTCIATTRLVDQNRAAFGADEQYVKDTLRDYLGCRTTILVDPMSGERTGHIDMFAHVVSREEVIVGRYAPGNDDANGRILDRAARAFEDAGLRVTRVPMPSNADGTYRSYTNALVVNDGVLVPVYAADRASEEDALQVFRTAYPGKTVVGVDADDVIASAGAIHCTTMTVSER